MMSLWKNLALLLLFLNASPLLRPHLLAHAGPTSPSVTRARILFVTALNADDEEDYDETETPISTSNVASPPITYQEPKLCKFDFCDENQEPCAKLSARTDCLCPGLSGSDVPPHAPRIAGIAPVNKGADIGKVEVKWCAPASEVSGYRVIIERNGDEALEFGKTLRKGLVGSLEVGTKVCVEAVNRAGHSAPTEFSCLRYNAPERSDHSMLAGIIGGGVTLFLLIPIAAVILWKCKICQKTKRDSDDGLGNPSYNKEGTL